MPRAFALIALAFFAGPLFADPTSDVMRLVPPKTTVCFVVQDLRGTVARLGESPFAAHFAESKLGKSLLASDELKQLATVEAFLLKDILGLTFAELRDDILGDAVAYAYQPPAEGKEGQDVGVLIGKAAKPDVLAKVVGKLNAAQLQSKELKATAEKKHNGVEYVERQKADGRTEYYLLRPDGVFVYTVQEAVVKQVIERLDGADKTPCPLTKAIDKLGATEATVVLLFEPAAFVGDLNAQEKAATDLNQKAFLSQFAKLWAATDAVGVTLTFSKEVTLAVTAVATPAKLPPELKSQFQSSDKPAAVWAAIPSDALLVIGGHFEWDKLHTAFQSFLSDEGKAGLKQIFDDALAPLVGKSTLPKVLAGLGPDWALWFSPPAKGDASPLPSATFAIRVRSGGNTDDSVGKAVVGALDALLHTFRVAYNRTHVDEYTLNDVEAGGVTVKALANDKALPVGVRPAYTLRGDYFVMASCVEAVVRFTSPKADGVVKGTPLVRLNASQLAKYLDGHGTKLGDLLAGWTGEKPEKAKSDLIEFVGVLELFDTIELHHTGDGQRMSLSIKAKTVKPLKK